MRKKTCLLPILALLTLAAFNSSIYHASAPPLSPYVMVVPPTQTIAHDSCMVAVTTDYSSPIYDLWGYMIQLTYNTSVLQCIQVNNGNLITEDEDPSARFNVTINEGIGEVSAGAYFYYNPQFPPPYTTSGPGTLVSITFRVLRAGTSNLIMQKATKLQGFNFTTNQVYNIIIADEKPNNIGNGEVIATLGDVNGDNTVSATDLTRMRNAYGSTEGPPQSPNWDSDCDFHEDNTIEARDLFHIGKNYGESW